METIASYLPVRIIFGRGRLEEGLAAAARLGRRPLVVTGRRSARASGLDARVESALRAAGAEPVFFREVLPEPTVENAAAGAAACRAAGCDAVVAVGGGSPLDAGKAVAVLAANGGSLRERFGEDAFPADPLPVAAVPTTCGTGSEVTRYAVIVDPAARTKKTVSSERIIPRLAVLDPALLDSLPPRLTAATAMDAVSHAAESILSLRANAFSRMHAGEALRVLREGLEGLAADPLSAESRDRLLYGSMLAGMAINQTGTIMVHGMGYALTVRYGLHHGTANAILLGPVLSFLRERGYAAAIDGIEELVGGIARLTAIAAAAGVPLRLSEAGASEADVPELAELCAAGCVRAARNMRAAPAAADFANILRGAL